MPEEKSQDIRRVAPRSFIDFSALKSLAQATADEIPNEALKLAKSSVEKTGEGLGLIAKGAADVAKAGFEKVKDKIDPPEVEIIEVPEGETPESMQAGGKGKRQMAGAAAAFDEKPKKRVVASRGVDLDDEDLDELRHILYGEVSNRPKEKKQLETRVIVNTVLNRVAENRRLGRGPQTVREVLTQDNQYQAFGEKQYKLSKQGKGDPNKVAAIDEVLAELEKGDFEENTNGAFYYIHNDDGSITYDDTRPLYK